ncbi:flagellar basal body-associated FliL family protein [Undibacterium sp. Rencai35W]|uniref:flagellar basal body-associated FliL family protein n=1 Tax=Undibacterium sp. Rencai35W TaxID=3413046 RepID=UPI003BF1F8F4
MPANDRPKNLLTSKIDFEGVEELTKQKATISDDSLDEWGFDLAAVTIPQAENQLPDPPYIAPPPPQPVAPPKERASPVSANNYARSSVKKSPVKKKDHFSQYAAAIILLLFIVSSVLVYLHMQRPPANTADLSYMALPQAVVNIDGQVTRVQVTIQVDTDDQDWLIENKKVLNEFFQIALAKVNADDLRTPEGFATMQQDLKKELNQAMHTDKIQAVLLTELLLQDKS